MSEEILSEEFCDTLGELFNIGMGRAANSLSDMVNEEVILSVPALQAMTYEEALDMYLSISNERVNAVEQFFDGQFSGNALLFFTNQSSEELVRRIIGDLGAGEDLNEIEQEALKEVSNIILNACFGCIAEVLDCEINSGVPSIITGNIAAVIGIDRIKLGRNPLVLTLSMTFHLPSNSIEGQVSLLMTSESIQKLIKELERFSSLYAF